MRPTPVTRRPLRRKVLRLLTSTLFAGSCEAAGLGTPNSQDRFKGIASILVVDAVPNAEMLGVDFYDDKGVRIYSSSVVARRNREIMGGFSGRMPSFVRVVWRDSTELADWDYTGRVIGDYTVPVADRIPEKVLRDIRARGGGLRLKFRLKEDGVLFGWDIERADGSMSKFDMPGGDFLETRY